MINTQITSPELGQGYQTHLLKTRIWAKNRIVCGLTEIIKYLHSVLYKNDGDEQFLIQMLKFSSSPSRTISLITTD